MKALEKYNPAHFPTKTISVAEAAKILDVGKNKIRRMLETGELHGGRFNTYWRVNEAMLHQHMRDSQ